MSDNKITFEKLDINDHQLIPDILQPYWEQQWRTKYLKSIDIAIDLQQPTSLQLTPISASNITDRYIQPNTSKYIVKTILEDPSSSDTLVVFTNNTIPGQGVILKRDGMAFVWLFITPETETKVVNWIADNSLAQAEWYNTNIYNPIVDVVNEFKHHFGVETNADEVLLRLFDKL